MSELDNVGGVGFRVGSDYKGIDFLEFLEILGRVLEFLKIF